LLVITFTPALSLKGEGGRTLTPALSLKGEGVRFLPLSG